MVTMIKGENVKFVNADWQVEALKADGWAVDGEEVHEDDDAPKRRGRPPKGE